jgi:hypothetical protein
MATRFMVMWLVAMIGSACGPTAPRGLSTLDDDEPMLTQRPALQMYLILTHQTEAMQDPRSIKEMWRAVHGERAEFRDIRTLVRWAPAEYAIDIELDFANLPHPALPMKMLQPSLRRLPSGVRQIGETAPLAVSVRSRSETLPAGEHLRLVGAAVLYMAEAFDGVIVDLMTRRAWTAEAWRTELSGRALTTAQTRLMVGQLSPNQYRLRSRGNIKFGLPDLELDASATQLSLAKTRLAVAQKQLMRTGRLTEENGQCLGNGYDGECLRVSMP